MTPACHLHRYSSRSDRFLYLLYIFCLPLGRVFIRPEGLPTTLTVMPLSSIIMLIGVAALCLRRGKLPFTPRLGFFYALYAFMVIYSLVAAFIVSTDTPVSHNTSVILAPLENIVLYFVVLLSLFYNYYFLSYVYPVQRLFPIFDASCVMVIAMGYIQLGALLGAGALVSLYSFLGGILAVMPLDILIRMERGVTCFGAEPSSMALYCFILIPYMIASVRLQKRRRTGHIVLLAMLLPLLVSSNSSSVIILLCMTGISSFIYFFKKRLIKWIIAGAFVTGAIVTSMYAIDAPQSISKNMSTDEKSFEYITYGKIVDRKNYSTMMRSSTLAVNMKLFYTYPVTGVGLGVQGVFYNQYVPSWTKRSNEVKTLMKSSSPLSNGGGSFFPIMLSSFGIIGIIVFTIFLLKYRKSASSSVISSDMMVRCIWNVSIPTIILALWYVASPKLNESMIFIISLAVITAARSNSGPIELNTYRR